MSKVLRFEITDKCNQKCYMCWSKNWRHIDMSWTDIKKMLVDFSRHESNGIVVLTSREPLLSPNFAKTVELCSELRLDTKILTNGTLLNDNNCRIITKNNVSFVGISLHGNETEHESIVNVKGSYKQTINGLKRLIKFKKTFKAKKLEIRITGVITKSLIKSIDEIICLSSELGTHLRLQHFMWHSEETKKIHKNELVERFKTEDTIIDGFTSNNTLTGCEVIKFIKSTKQKCHDYNVDLQFYPDLSNEEILEWYDETSNFPKDIKFCDHCTNSIRVRANGEISLCQYINVKIGDLRNQSIEEIIYNNEKYHQICKELENGQLFPICYRCCHSRNSIIDDSHNYKI